MNTITNNMRSRRITGSSALLALLFGVLVTFVVGFANPAPAEAQSYGGDYYGDDYGGDYYGDDYSGDYYGDNSDSGYYYDGTCTDCGGTYGGDYYGDDYTDTTDYYGGDYYGDDYYSGDYSGDNYYSGDYSDNSDYYDGGSYINDYPYYDNTDYYSYYDTPTYYYDTPSYTYVPPVYNPPHNNPPPVNPPHYDAPTCTLDASATSIIEGKGVVLTWTTSNATSASLTNFGSVNTGSGSRDVNSLNAGTYTYTMHVSGQGGSGNCDITIHVTPHQNPPQNVSCDLSADDTSIEDGDDVKLRWNSDNADSARLNQGIGSVSTDGSRTVSPSDDTTYALTVRNNDGDEDTCSVTVHVSNHHNNNLSCDLTASDRSIERGDSTTLRWDTSGNVDSARINQGIGSVDENGGSERVSPDSDTTYRLTVENNDGDEETCDVTINVDDNGLTPPPDVPLVYLSQLPYTGLELDPGSMMAYILILLGGSGIVGYFLFFRAMPFALARMKAGKGAASVDASTPDAPTVLQNVTRQDVRAFVSSLTEKDSASAHEFAKGMGPALFAETAVVLDDALRARTTGSMADAQVSAMTASWSDEKLSALVDAFAGENDSAIDSAISN